MGGSYLKSLELSILPHNFLGTPIKITPFNPVNHFLLETLTSWPPHSPEFLLTSRVALSQPPDFYSFFHSYLQEVVSHRLSPASIVLSRYLLSIDEILCFHSFKCQLCADDSPQFIFKSPRLFSTLQTKHLMFLPKDLTDILNLTCPNLNRYLPTPKPAYTLHHIFPISGNGTTQWLEPKTSKSSLIPLFPSNQIHESS